MALDFGKLLSEAHSSFVPTQFALRAQVQWARTGDKQTDVEFLRNGVRLPPQTVRVEFHDTVPSDADDASGVSWFKRGVLFGIAGHPELDDTDVRVWDTFVMDNREYTIMFVNRQMHGQVQADFEAVGNG